MSMPLFKSDFKKRNKIRRTIRNFFLRHPSINPYANEYGGIHRILTASLRKLPDFLIIGAGKCGTSSLYYYMIQHEKILSDRQKELNFFDFNYEKSLNWYKSQFPLKFHKFHFLTGEATPYYFYHPLVPSRVKKSLPNVKMIILLRNPTDRAYSHYQHSVKRGYETLSFEDAIEKEEERLSSGDFNDLNHGAFSYLSEGLYFIQLKRWLSFFPLKQFLIIKTEDLLVKRGATLNKIFNFLELSSFEIERKTEMNVGKYKPMKIETRKKLNEYFKPFNEELIEFLGMDFDLGK